MRLSRSCGGIVSTSLREHARDLRLLGIPERHAQCDSFGGLRELELATAQCREIGTHPVLDALDVGLRAVTAEQLHDAGSRETGKRLHQLLEVLFRNDRERCARAGLLGKAEE